MKANPTVVERLAFGRERSTTAGIDGVARRGGRHEKSIRYTDIQRMRFSRTRMGFNRSSFRWTIEGAGQRITVALTTDSSASPELAAFRCFIDACLDHVFVVRPDVRVTIGMAWGWWLVWLGTVGLALVGLAAAIAMMLDSGSLLVQGPPVLALLAGLPACVKNVHEGWPKRVSGGEARAILAGSLPETCPTRVH